MTPAVNYTKIYINALVHLKKTKKKNFGPEHEHVNFQQRGKAN